MEAFSPNRSNLTGKWQRSKRRQASSSEEHTGTVLCSSLNEPPRRPQGLPSLGTRQVWALCPLPSPLPPALRLHCPYFTQFECTLRATRSPMLPSQGVTGGLSTLCCGSDPTAGHSLFSCLHSPKNPELQDGIHCYSNPWLPTVCGHCYTGEPDSCPQGAAVQQERL